jgi:ketosteroid isomerase-like protein
LGIHAARVTVTMTPPDGAAVIRSGYTLTILRKEADGQWRLARDANMLTVEK